MIIVVLIFIIIAMACLIRMQAQGRQLREYEKSDKMKSVFLKALSREIRTPLHSVSGLAEIISKEDLYLSKSEKRNISDQIKYNTGIISTLLDEVTIASGSSSGHKLEDERFSPNQVCQRCIDANRVILQEGVKLVFRRDAGDGLFVSADLHIIELVLNKLISSACKFTHQGEIAVGCHYEEIQHLLTFYVQDTGVGIPEQRKDQLFGWFDNPSSLTDEIEFDLSIAQRLANKIGGIVRQDDTYSNGTCMLFTVPVR